MNILVLSEEADSIGLSYKMQQEGHNVLYWMKTPALSGDGIVEKVKNYQSKLQWPDLVISDSNITDKNEIGRASCRERV